MRKSEGHTGGAGSAHHDRRGGGPPASAGGRARRCVTSQAQLGTADGVRPPKFGCQSAWPKLAGPSPELGNSLRCSTRVLRRVGMTVGPPARGFSKGRAPHGRCFHGAGASRPSRSLLAWIYIVVQITMAAAHLHSLTDRQLAV